MSVDAKHVAVAAKSVVSVYRVTVKSFVPFVLAFNYMHKVSNAMQSEIHDVHFVDTFWFRN